MDEQLRFLRNFLGSFPIFVSPSAIYGKLLGNQYSTHIGNREWAAINTMGDLDFLYRL